MSRGCGSVEEGVKTPPAGEGIPRDTSPFPNLPRASHDSPLLPLSLSARDDPACALPIASTVGVGADWGYADWGSSM